MRPGTQGGSRFLYDSFDPTAARVEANARVQTERWAGLEYRLGQIEESGVQAAWIKLSAGDDGVTEAEA